MAAHLLRSDPLGKHYMSLADTPHVDQAEAGGKHADSYADVKGSINDGPAAPQKQQTQQHRVANVVSSSTPRWRAAFPQLYVKLVRCHNKRHA